MFTVYSIITVEFQAIELHVSDEDHMLTVKKHTHTHTPILEMTNATTITRCYDESVLPGSLY